MDIKINNNDLKDLINILEKDNLNIYNIVKDINISYKSLDNTKWSSNEKTKLDSSLYPFIDNIDKYLLSYLNDCTNSLKLASNLYTETDLNIKNNIDII